MSKSIRAWFGAQDAPLSYLPEVLNSGWMPLLSLGIIEHRPLPAMCIDNSLADAQEPDYLARFYANQSC